MSRLTRSFSALAALLLAALALLTGGVAAHAAEKPGTTSWTVRTALSKYGSDRAKFTYTVRPGEDLTDGIDIANHGAAPITLKIYAADGFTTDSGGFDILNPEKTSSGIGVWVKPATNHVTLKPNQAVQIPFTMTVPENATPGDHAGGIVTVLDEPAGTGQTVIHQRVGLRLTARVSGKVTSRLSIEDVTVNHSGQNPFGTGRTSVSYTVHNTGNTTLGGIQKVTFASELGISAKTVELKRLPSLLPGESWKSEASVDDVRALLWLSATVKVTPVVTDSAGSTTTLPDVTAKGRTLVSIWSLVIAIVVLIALGILIRLAIVLVQRRKQSTQAKVDAKVAAAVEDALREKAEP